MSNIPALFHMLACNIPSILIYSIPAVVTATPHHAPPTQTALKAALIAYSNLSGPSRFCCPCQWDPAKAGENLGAPISSGLSAFGKLASPPLFTSFYGCGVPNTIFVENNCFFVCDE